MKTRTHLSIDQSLCGSPLDLSDGAATVALDTTDQMSVDEEGLVHGGFVFGLADYAAMLAVDDPNVVLGSARTRFLKPVRRGQRVVATAQTVRSEGRRHEVQVEAVVGSTKVFEGTFTCIVLEHHVLEGAGSTK